MAKIPLAAARVAKGWTQKELADLMGVSAQLIWEWENGKREMRPVYLYAFCHLSGFSTDDISLPEKLS